MGKNPAEKAKTKTTENAPAKAQSQKPKKTKRKVAVLARESHDKKHCGSKGCKRRYRAKGYCCFHYKKWRQGAFGSQRYRRCGEVECKNPMALNRHGYCDKHYQDYYVKVIETAKPEKTDEQPKQAAA